MEVLWLRRIMGLGICRRMQTTTGHRSLATPLPTVANAHHHESEYINFIITIFIKIIATGLYGVYVLRVLCIFYSSYFISIHKEKEEKRKGNWLWYRWARFWFCISHQKGRVYRFKSVGQRQSILWNCYCFHLVAPMARKMVIHCVLAKVFLHRFPSFCSVNRSKVGFAPVDILVYSRDWLVRRR